MRRTFIINLLSLSVMFFAGCGSNGAGAEQAFIDLPELYTGDIVFRKGKGMKSRAVTMFDADGIYSHAGLAVRVDGNVYIIHAVPGEAGTGPDVVKMEPLAEFFGKRRAAEGMVVRSVSVDVDMELVAQRALGFYRRGLPFDEDYNLSDTTSLYCTELVWRSYAAAGWDITDGRRSAVDAGGLYDGAYIMPSNIYRNDKLTTIYKF